MTPMTGNNIIYKPKLSEDIKAVPEEPVHAQVYIVTEVYGRILDQGRKKNVKMLEQVFILKRKSKHRYQLVKGEKEDRIA